MRVRPLSAGLEREVRECGKTDKLPPMHSIHILPRLRAACERSSTLVRSLSPHFRVARSLAGRRPRPSLSSPVQVVK